MDGYHKQLLAANYLLDEEEPVRVVVVGALQKAHINARKDLVPFGITCRVGYRKLRPRRFALGKVPEPVNKIIVG